MMNIIRNLVNKSVYSEEKPLNIITLFYDGCYCSDLARTGHNFYGSFKAAVEWHPVDELPANVINLDDIRSMSTVVTGDLVMNQSPYTVEYNQKYGMGLHLPIVVVSHECFPKPVVDDMAYVMFDNKSYYHVADNKWCAVSQKSNFIARAISDKAYEAEKKDIPVLLHGNFLPYDYPVLRSIQSAIPGTVIIGNSPGLAKPVVGQEYYDLFARAQIYINFVSANHLTHSLITAMKSGCAIVSNRTDYLKAQLGDAVRFGPTPDAAKDICLSLLEEKGEMDFLRKEARLYLEKNHPTIDQFVQQWKELLNVLKHEVFVA